MDECAKNPASSANEWQKGFPQVLMQADVYPDQTDAQDKCSTLFHASVEAAGGSDSQPWDPGEVQLRETHISWVFLIGSVAYKVKKPIKNDFLDYSTLERRQRFCELEYRLDRRYAPELYLGVVPIADTSEGIRVEAEGHVIEYAVKMQRFAADDLLRNALQRDAVTLESMIELAEKLAEFHHHAKPLRVGDLGLRESETQGAELNSADLRSCGTSQSILQDALDNFNGIDRALVDAFGEEAYETVSVISRVNGQADATAIDLKSQLIALREWTLSQAASMGPQFERRLAKGMVRECHGDLHTNNIVRWRGRWVPFDGIEFCDRFRLIDVYSDLAFLLMDLLARGHSRLAYAVRDAYLNATGDFSDLQVLRWYVIYRAMVRGKVDALRMGQCKAGSVERTDAAKEMYRFINLAYKLANREAPTLWITHGFSGSGKSTGAARIVQTEDAICLRSDVERKRLLGKPPTYRPDASDRELYSPEHTERTYETLATLAEEILRAGESVVIDATFLKHDQRRRMQTLATAVNARYRILNFEANSDVLRSRIEARQQRGTDASDADVRVLKNQMAAADPLTEEEQDWVCDFE